MTDDASNLPKIPTPSASVFEASTVVGARPEVLFTFHADPRNLTEVMPPTLKLVKLVTDGPALEGRLIELHCRDWWVIPMHWVCRWKQVSPPHLLVDEIIEGPFRSSSMSTVSRRWPMGEPGCMTESLMPSARDGVDASSPRSACASICGFSLLFDITARAAGHGAIQLPVQLHEPGRRAVVPRAGGAW